MIFDEVRNKAYADALKKHVRSDSVVLDLGAGLGIHGLVAAACGARKVFLVEKESVIEVASRIARDNGMEHQLEFLHGRIQEIVLPVKVDIITSVFTGNFLLTEDLLPSLFVARDKYLAPDGLLIPDRAAMYIVPVSAMDFYDKHLVAWSGKMLEINFSAARSYAANWVYYEDANEIGAEFLAEPVRLMELDFQTAVAADCHQHLVMTISRAGTCHGLLGWFDMRLGEAWLSTSPMTEKTHWSQAFLPLDPPIEVIAGDRLKVEIDRPENGEWTWIVSHKDTVQKSSTFLANPVMPGDLSKRSDAFAPGLNRKGEALQFLLTRMDGRHQAAALSKELIATFPDVFLTPGEARRFVKKIVTWLA